MAALNSALTFLCPILIRRKTPSPNLWRFYFHYLLFESNMRNIQFRENLRLQSFLGKALYFQHHIMTVSIWPKNLHIRVFLQFFFFFKERISTIKRAEKESPRNNVSLCSPISLCREVLRDKFLSSETAVFFTAGWLTCSIVRILGRPFAFWTTVRATANGIY